MKVTIVAPQYKEPGEFYELPLGLAYISSYLKNRSVDVDFINMNEGQQLLKPADILLTGGLSVHYHKVKAIIQRARQLNPKVKTIVGGGLVSSMPEEMLSMLEFDIGVVGEGEETACEAVYNYQAMDLPKILTSSPIKDLDSLPFPDYDGLGIKNYLDRQLCGDEHYLYPFDKPRCLPIISSRSCPHSCSFCFHPMGKSYRQRSLDNYFKELEYLIDKYKINMISVLDELMAQFPARMSEFCDRIKPYNLKWMAQTRLDSVDEGTLRKLKDSGCIQLSVGVEHVSQTILDSFKKRSSLSVIEKSLELIYQAGIGIQGNILLGDIAETNETVKEAVEWRNAHAKYALNIAQVTPYPGTALFDHCVKAGLIKPAEYVEGHCGFVKMTDANMQFPVLMNWATSVTPAVIGNDKTRGKLYKIECRCPHCKNVTDYNNLYWGGSAVQFNGGQSYRIGCKNCNQRIDINPKYFGR